MYILDGVALVGYVMSHWRIPVPVFDQHDTTWLLTEASSTDPVSWSIPKPRSMRKHPKPPPGQASSKNPARILSLYRAMRIEAPEPIDCSSADATQEPTEQGDKNDDKGAYALPVSDKLPLIRECRDDMSPEKIQYASRRMHAIGAHKHTYKTTEFAAHCRLAAANVGPIQGPNVANAYRQIMESRDIKLRYWGLGQDNVRILRYCSKDRPGHDPIVKKLDCGGNNLSTLGFANLLSLVHPHVEEIDASEATDGTMLKALLQWLSSTAATPRTSWKPQMLRGAKLRVLDISNTPVKGPLIVRLLALLHRAPLEYLNMGATMCSDATVGKAFHLFFSSVETLKRLDLHFNCFGGTSAHYLLEGIYLSTTLEELDLSYNAIGHGTNADLAVDSLCKVFGNSTVPLFHVDLSYCGFTESHMHRIATSLTSNSTIWGLHLWGNGGYVDADGFVRVFDFGNTDDDECRMPEQRVGNVDSRGGTTSCAYSSLLGSTKTSDRVLYAQNLSENIHNMYRTDRWEDRVRGQFGPESFGQNGRVYDAVARLLCNCWVCERWVETVLTFTPEKSDAQEVTSVQAFVSVNQFEYPTMLTQKGLKWVGYRMLPPTRARIECIFVVNGKPCVASDLPVRRVRAPRRVGHDDVFNVNILDVEKCIPQSFGAGPGRVHPVITPLTAPSYHVRPRSHAEPRIS
eukprot:GEMP01017475.1.p1 GENE.GEMP01017475.1~~GEMP01017475.1.p1  ORF type:complete len:686 (+),score=134.03 GEMP01017475.1:138-2195(+)